MKGTHRWMIVGAVLAAILLVAVVLNALASTPINEQNCSELADTYDKLGEVIADPSASVDDMRHAMNDSADLNDRANELGGCPGEPTLTTNPLAGG